MSYLESCSDVLSDLGGHLRLSEAILEPSWATLDAPVPRDRARPEGGGGVHLSPKGKKGVGMERGGAKPFRP